MRNASSISLNAMSRRGCDYQTVVFPTDKPWKADSTSSHDRAGTFIDPGRKAARKRDKQINGSKQTSKQTTSTNGKGRTGTCFLEIRATSIVAARDAPGTSHASPCSTCARRLRLRTSSIAASSCRVDEADRGSARPGAANSPMGPPAKGGNGMNRTHKRTCPVFLPHR